MSSSEFVRFIVKVVHNTAWLVIFIFWVSQELSAITFVLRSSRQSIDSNASAAKPHRLEMQGTIQYRLQGTGIPYTRCIPHTVYLVHRNSKSEERLTSRHKNNSKIVHLCTLDRRCLQL